MKYLIILGAVLGSFLATPTPIDARPKCVGLKKIVRQQAYGYNHVVEITNACEKPVRCHVTTNSNPVGVYTNVPAKKSVQETLFLSSPAYKFTAKAECWWQDG